MEISVDGVGRPKFDFHTAANHAYRNTSGEASSTGTTWSMSRLCEDALQARSAQGLQANSVTQMGFPPVFSYHV